VNSVNKRLLIGKFPFAQVHSPIRFDKIVSVVT